jgi:hypothetical protein
MNRLNMCESHRPTPPSIWQRALRGRDGTATSLSFLAGGGMVVLLIVLCISTCTLHFVDWARLKNAAIHDDDRYYWWWVTTEVGAASRVGIYQRASYPMDWPNTVFCDYTRMETSDLPSWLLAGIDKFRLRDRGSEWCAVIVVGWPMPAFSYYSSSQAPAEGDFAQCNATRSHVTGGLLYHSGSMTPIAGLVPHAIPMTPMWLGLGVDYGVSCLIFAFAYAAYVQARRGYRRARKCCESCGYFLHQDTSKRCPECGTDKLGKRARVAKA